jgi:hypothetical protein
LSYNNEIASLRKELEERTEEFIKQEHELDEKAKSVVNRTLETSQIKM